MTIKWKMVSHTHFIGEAGPYTITAMLIGLGWYWTIQLGTTTIDTASQHPHAPSNELDAKIKAQRALNIVSERGIKF
jgi:hypothetical protein